MSFALIHDIGALIKTVRAFANTSLTAAGGGDNTLITGAILDRLSGVDMPLSCVIAVPYTTTLTDAKSLILKTSVVEHGDDSGLSDAATFATLEDSTGTKLVTSSGGGTYTGTKEYSLDLTGAKRYIRVKTTPDLDASGTDTAAISGVVIFGPAAQLPE
jgi:hypothetical protein